jgi:intraflagellar transport protein 81
MAAAPERDIEEKIVDLLRTHFDLKFTLVGFAEIAGRELLELLNMILSKISDTQPEKLGTEKIEATVDRMSEFFRVLKYEFPCEPEEWDVRLTAADTKLIYPAMLWLLQDLPGMKERAYRARFSEEVAVPEEIRVDPTVSELIGQHRELRERFDQVLAEHTVLGGTNVDELKKTIAGLEADRARLATKIGGYKRQMSKIKNLDELLRWTSKLREETDREMRLRDQLQHLSDDKRVLIHRQDAATEKQKNVKVSMDRRLQEARQELAELKNQGKGGQGDEKNLAFCQQQVVAANKRLDQKKKQLADMQKTRQEAEQQLQERQADGPLEIPSPTEFAKYVKSLKQKNENYRDLQTQIAAQRKELAILLRTEEIVNAQKDQVRAEIAKIERQRGVGGFREAREQLEKVSATKADVDDIKGKTLEEMSAISKDIQRAIQARQTELKPIVNKLQDQRKKTATVESKYLQARQRYQNAVSEYDGVCMQLDEECKKLRTDIAHHQSKFHTVSSRLQELGRVARRAREEANAQQTGNPVSKTIKTYSDHFQKAARQMKKDIQTLKDERKSLGTQSEASQRQLELFQSLRRLLQVKLECIKQLIMDRKRREMMDEVERKNPEEKIDI